MQSRVSIAIVGSGPAGLGAALRAARLGLSHVLIEKADRPADTIRGYHRRKPVTAEPSAVPLRADLDFADGTREKVLTLFENAAGEVNALFGAEVTAITGGKGDFTLHLASGEPILAETVVLATGTQDNPERLPCPVADDAVVQYGLDDPAGHYGEHVTVVGAGDTGIEIALALAADPQQRNKVTIVDRSADLPKAQEASVRALQAMASEGRVTVLRETVPTRIDKGTITLDTRDGGRTMRCDRVIACLGSAPPRRLLQAAGVVFAGEDRSSCLRLSPTHETSVPGLYVIGALAGQASIKPCLNQGHDVVEFIAGNRTLQPADAPLLAARLPGDRSVDEWLDLFAAIAIFRDLSRVQLRDLIRDADIRRFATGETVFARNEAGTSLFAVAEGSVLVEGDDEPIAQGSIFGEIGLIAGRRRAATVRVAEPTIVVELSRLAGLRLGMVAPAAEQAITRISVSRQLRQIFGSGLTGDDLAELNTYAEVIEVRAGEVVIREGAEGEDIYVVRRGSLIVEKTVAGEPVFLSYLQPGAYVGEMALISGTPRAATVRAAVRSEVIRLPGHAFARLLARKPELLRKALADMADRREVNSFVVERHETAPTATGAS